MKIRLAIKQDAADLMQLAIVSAEVARADFNEHGWQTFLAPNTLEKTVARILHDDYLMLVAEQHSKLVGMLVLFEMQKIDQFFVHPDLLGKGIGKQLWQRAYSDIKRLSNHLNPALWVRSSSYAIPIYQSFGFKRDGRPQNSNGITFQLMRRPVTPAITT